MWFKLITIIYSYIHIFMNEYILYAHVIRYYLYMYKRSANKINKNKYNECKKTITIIIISIHSYTYYNIVL